MTIAEKLIAQVIREFKWWDYGMDDFPVNEEVVSDLAIAIADKIRGKE